MGVETEMVQPSATINVAGAQKCQSGSGSMTRMGKAGEIASIALFLASDDSSLVNGATLVADAGWTAY